MGPSRGGVGGAQTEQGRGRECACLRLREGQAGAGTLSERLCGGPSPIAETQSRAPPYIFIEGIH